MYKITVYVPESHVETVKSALFDAGAGRIGNYDSCCWQVLGQGQFKPLKGSNPAIGQQQQDEQVAEYKVELVCAEAYITHALDAMIAAHPYEEPAYDVIKIQTLKDFS